MKAFWDSRYSQSEYAYGIEPNQYLKTVLPQFSPQTILFPAEGEGRNAVYAAKLGWKVFACDQSVEGQKKAHQLADQNNVQVDYTVCDIHDAPYFVHQFDAMSLIYVHFSPEQKSLYHKKLASFVKPNGIVILEAFSKNNLSYVEANPNVGGPRDLGRLVSIEEIQTDFDDFELIYLNEEEIELHEGMYHVGKASVIRFIGRKK